MSLLIRCENPADYAAVANVHIQAFDNRSDEATLVMLLRQRASYDPDLSLVAEIDGKIVGHAMFTPYMVQFAAIPVPGVNLAPLAVLPAYQNQGVGAALMKEGHCIATRKGYEVSFLLGHTSYYPRFGYQTKAFGQSSITITKDNLEGMALPVTVREPLPDDVPALFNLWLTEEEDVEFVLEPEQNLNDWISPNPVYRAQVYIQGTHIIGYTRGRPDEPLVFLAKHEPAAKDICTYLLKTYDRLKLPLHPNSRSVRAFVLDEAPQSIPKAAMMVRALRYEPLINRYLKSIQEDEHPAGRPIFPPAFDLI